MTLIASPKQAHHSARPNLRRGGPNTAPSVHRGVRTAARDAARLGARATRDRSALGRYVDTRGRAREVVACAGRAGSVLVLDRDALTLGDRRLVAHLAPDEPRENAELVCCHYLRDPRGRRCRPVRQEDLEAPGSTEASGDGKLENALTERPGELVDREGRRHSLGLLTSRLSIPELRWLAHPLDAETAEPQPLSVREVVARLESYEPVRAHTARALARHREDPAVSVAVLRAELERIDASRIVLNRGLRAAVLSAVQKQGLSMSEIAVRCGRVKRDSHGNASGETSWLARRIGIVPEGGESSPTPWIHSDVLALISRTGLGLSPREVELG
jgi:hypothetical protein